MSAFLASWTGRTVANAVAEPDGERMLEVLNLTGTRRMPDAIGVWPDLDGPELRAAIRWTGHTLPCRDAGRAWDRGEIPAAGLPKSRARRAVRCLAGQGRK